MKLVTKIFFYLLTIFFIILGNQISIAQWVQTNGPGGGVVYTFAVSDTNLFAGSYSGNVWRRPLSEMITSVDGSSIDLPIGFVLSQNYPNPFNPTTKIKYEIPELSFVTLKVFDLLGNEIASLVNEEKLTGTCEVEFNGIGLPSGIYFYQLKSDNYIETKKMLLLK